MTEVNGTARIAAFTKLTTNVKTQICDELGPITAFLGANFSGKTARLDAIRLALTGKHPVGPHGSDLMELVPENAASLFATLEGPSGMSTFKLNIDAAKGKAEKPLPAERFGLFRELMTDADMENILPAQTMSSLIKLGSTLGREAILKRFGDASSVPTPRGLTDAQTALWTEGLTAVKAAAPSADASTQLAELSSWMRQRKLELGRNAKSLDKLIKDREAQTTATAAGTEQLPQWKKQLVEAEAWERAASLRQRKAQIEVEIEAYRTKVAPFNTKDSAAEVAAHQADIEKNNQETAALEAQLAEARAAVTDSVERLAFGDGLLRCLDIEGPCVLCGNPEFDRNAARPQIEPRVEQRREQLAALRTKELELGNSLMALIDARRDLEKGFVAKGQAEEQAKNVLRQEASRLKAAKEENALALQGAPIDYKGTTAEVLRAQIRSAEVNQVQTRTIDDEVAKYRKLVAEQEVAKVLEQEATKALSALLARTSEVANATVNKYMPTGFRASLDLETAKWQMFGTDNRPHGKSVMAGSEQGALIVSLALAWTEGAPARFLLLEDDDLAPFSPENLVKLFDALKAAVDDGLLTQVFVAWARPHEIPDYVHRVMVGGAPTVTSTTAAPGRAAPVALVDHQHQAPADLAAAALL